MNTNKLVLVIIVGAMFSIGCAIPLGNGVRMGILTSGINLTVIHECSERAKLYSGGGLITEVDGPTPKERVVWPNNAGDVNTKRRPFVIINVLIAGGKNENPPNPDGR